MSRKRSMLDYLGGGAGAKAAGAPKASASRFVPCPICGRSVFADRINEHLDSACGEGGEAETPAAAQPKAKAKAAPEQAHALAQTQVRKHAKSLEPEPGGRAQAPSSSEPRAKAPEPAAAAAAAAPAAARAPDAEARGGVFASMMARAAEKGRRESFLLTAEGGGSYSWEWQPLLDDAAVTEGAATAEGAAVGAVEGAAVWACDVKLKERGSAKDGLIKLRTNIAPALEGTFPCAVAHSRLSVSMLKSLLQVIPQISPAVDSLGNPLVLILEWSL